MKKELNPNKNIYLLFRALRTPSNSLAGNSCCVHYLPHATHWLCTSIRSSTPTRKASLSAQSSSLMEAGVLVASVTTPRPRSIFSAIATKRYQYSFLEFPPKKTVEAKFPCMTGSNAVT